MNKLVIFSIFLSTLTLSYGCDIHRLKKCEWYLVPEPQHKKLVEDGWVPLCARNYATKKQRCYFQAKLDFAEKIYGKKFRFVDIEFEEYPIPRKILSANSCE